MPEADDNNPAEPPEANSAQSGQESTESKNPDPQQPDAKAKSAPKPEPAPADPEQVPDSEKPAAQPKAPIKANKVLAVDDEKHMCDMVQTILTSAGIETITANSGEEALPLISPEIGLLLTDLKMPSMNGVELIKAARSKGWAGKAIILTGFPDKESVLGASQLGVTEYLTKPFERVNLLDRVEETLRLEKELGDISADDSMRECILDPQKSVPVFVAGEVELSIEDLEALALGNGTLLDEGAVVSTRDYFAVNDIAKIPELSGREPTLKKDKPIDKAEIRGISRIVRDKYAGLVTGDKNVTNTITLARNPMLGEHMTRGQGLIPDAFAAKLKSNPMCSHILNASKSDQIEPIFTAMGDAWRHHEVAYLMYKIKARENRRLLNHIFSTTFFAVLHTQQQLAGEMPDLSPDDKRVCLAIMGVCAALHDLGMSDIPGDMEFGSKAYLETWKKHAVNAFKIVRNANIYPEIKFAIRDHHKPLIVRRSRYDVVTRIVQLASDIDNMVQGQGVVMNENGPVMVREAQVLPEACRALIFRARQGVYHEADVELMLNACKFDALVNYYSRLREINRRPCKNILLSPNEVNPITALCQGGLEVAAEHKQYSYCHGCTPGKSHAYHGSFYSRCLFGHDEITELNQNIKHLTQQQDEEETINAETAQTDSEQEQEATDKPENESEAADRNKQEAEPKPDNAADNEPEGKQESGGQEDAAKDDKPTLSSPEE